MGSRRTDVESAVSSARAAWIAGFASTSNLEAGRRYGIPTAGTAAHAFVMLFPDEQARPSRPRSTSSAPAPPCWSTPMTPKKGFAGPWPRPAPVSAPCGSTRATWPTKPGGPAGNSTSSAPWTPGSSSPATSTGRASGLLAGAPVDAYGVGTSVVTGGGAPTAGFVYKLVAAAPTATTRPPPATGGQAVARQGDVPGANGPGGCSTQGRAVGEEVALVEPAGRPMPPLQLPLDQSGQIIHRPSLAEIRDHHRNAVAELPPGGRLPLRIRPGKAWADSDSQSIQVREFLSQCRS